ncbi:putative membrane protein YgcG [Cryobacterium mesophilum]|uniref:DUF2207 domain-containing protein n=1 Tax=Terrimesophilobacter mesophilus TaxID=433647 RepID=UPI0014255048|nr:DUF2207 domain-containing protein [Terrimesophilobacter mesophilus]MBB5632540.1 putative membrane protein YgcG [Terrimesophilobacter mesophilus]
MRLRRAAASAVSALVLLVPLAIGGLASNAAASTQDFSFTSMSSDFFLGRDAGGNATLRTVETLVAEFPDFDQNHGIERAIPDRYGEARLELAIVSVTDAAGNAVEYSTSHEDGFTVLRIGSADAFVHGTVTYRIEYTQRNVVGSFADTDADEFYWDVNGTGWGQPFGSVSATVHLENGIAGSLTGNLACYQGYEGSTDTCDITRTGDTIRASVSDLAPYQTMTIAIGFDRATFVDPPLLKNNWLFAVLPWVLIALTVAAFLFIIGVRVFLWRDARGRGIIIPEYSSLPDVYPMLAAELLGKTNAALPAQIVRFAVARILAIREHPARPTDARYELELLAGWPTVSHDERWVLKVLFGKLAVGKRVTLNSSDTAIGDRFASHTLDMLTEVRTRRWRAQPKSRIPRIVRWSTFGLAGAAVALWFVSIGLDVEAPGLGPAAVVCVVGWVVVASLASRPYLITDKGAVVRDHFFGMRDYISLAEADRIRVLQAPGTAERVDVTDESAVIKLYEKLLPYAMIFGLEREWIAELGRHYDVTEQPSWYSGSTDLAAVSVFTNSLASTHFATTPPPPSSSSSWGSSGGSSFSGGSSGGGFSGGGGGGGGGGGW